jgi:hypothetical protein
MLADRQLVFVVQSSFSLPSGRLRAARKAAEGHQYQGKPLLPIEFEYLGSPDLNEVKL